MDKILRFTVSFLFSLVLFCSIPTLSNGQIQTGELPAGIKLNKRAISQIPVFSLPDMEKYSSDNESEELTGKQKKLVFANVYKTMILPEVYGSWSRQKDGSKIWRLAIYSQNALSLNFTLEYNLKPGAKLFVYTPDKKYVAGAFTHRNNKSSGLLSIAPVPGNTTIIEYFEPKKNTFTDDFRIISIGHDFLGITDNLKKNLKIRGASGSCNVDINCPEGDYWQLEKNAICKIIVNNKELCTGVLVNNTRDNGKPYFLTAKHCIGTLYEANSTVFYFNYENITCDGIYNPLFNTMSGSSLKATSFDLDFTLVELTEEPPEEYSPFYVGWNIENTPPEQSYCIHHPNGDVKKISVDNDPAVTGDYGEDLDPYSHWKILHWEIGTTEKGSSGAPLFDQNHRLIGILTGGEANCTNSVNDYFSKTHHIWDKYDSETEQIKAWIDPTNSGVSDYHGNNPYELEYDFDVEIWKKISPEFELCNQDTIQPSVLFRNKGKQTLSEVTIGYIIDNQPPVEIVWQGELASNLVDRIDFDKVVLSAGKHEITYYSQYPNNIDDENTLNDTLIFDFEISNGIQLLLELQTDNYGSETSWELVNSENEIIKQGSNYGNNILIKTEICAPTECFNFKIYDKGDDGLCCEYGDGYYQLINQAINDTIIFGKQFEDKDSTFFCLSKFITPSKPSEILKSFTVYPNPGKDDFKIFALDTGGQRVFIPDEVIELRVCDITGRTVLERIYENKDISFNLSYCEQGLYFAIIIIDKKQYVCKFQKK